MNIEQQDTTRLAKENMKSYIAKNNKYQSAKT